MGDAAVFALENWDPNSKNAPLDKNGNALTILNVGTGTDISIKDLANKISRITNFKGEIIWDHSKPDGTPKKILKINRLIELGWKPKISLDDGIKETVKIYLENFKK